jgi:hypothetical protein
VIGELLSYEDLVALSLTCTALDHDIMGLYMAYAGIAWHVSLVQSLRRQKQNLVRHVFLEHHLPTADDTWFQKVTHVTCGQLFEVRFRRGSLPSSLTHLTLGIAFNQPLPPGVLPPNIQELIFGLHFNQPIVQGCLPPGLRKLVFGHSFNKRLDAGVFPTSLESLQFGNLYNQPLPVGLLTPPLQHLMFGDAFNQPLAIATVPMGLRQLRFGAGFNQSLKHVLPASLLQLTLGDDFRQHDTGRMLPAGLQHLILGHYIGMIADTTQLSIDQICHMLPVVLDEHLGVIQEQPSQGQSHLPLGADQPVPRLSSPRGQTFERDGVPAGLLHLTFGYARTQHFAEDTIPAHRAFGARFNYRIQATNKPSSWIEFSVNYASGYPVGNLIMSRDNLHPVPEPQVAGQLVGRLSD